MIEHVDYVCPLCNKSDELIKDYYPYKIEEYVICVRCNYLVKTKIKGD